MSLSFPNPHGPAERARSAHELNAQRTRTRAPTSSQCATVRDIVRLSYPELAAGAGAAVVVVVVAGGLVAAVGGFVVVDVVVVEAVLLLAVLVGDGPGPPAALSSGGLPGFGICQGTSEERVREKELEATEINMPSQVVNLLLVGDTNQNERARGAGVTCGLSPFT